MGLTDRGHLRPGARADFLCLTPEITAGGTWIGGGRVA
jgi:N-acetylglucosamine-6-phosphate deacetylase